MTSETQIKFHLVFENSQGGLHPQTMYELLLKNKTIRDHTSDSFYSGKCEKVAINHDNEWYRIDLDDFDASIWKNCLKEAQENRKIVEFKESADGLWEQALRLIDDVITSS